MISNRSFWKTSRVLLGYKRTIALGGAAALVNAACFGAGLSMMLPVLHLLLQQKESLGAMLRRVVEGPGVPGWTRAAGLWLADHIPADAFNAFVLTMGVLLGLTLIGTVARFTHAMLTETVAARGAMIWRLRLYHRLLHARWAEVQVQGQFNHVSRVLTDVVMLGQGYRSVLNRSVEDSTKGLAALLAALVIDWRLTLIALAVVPVIVLILGKFGKSLRRAAKRALQHSGRLLAITQESLRSLAVVKVHHAEGYERRRFRNEVRGLFRQDLKMRRARAISSPMVELMAVGGVIGVAVAAAWYVFERGVEPARFMATLGALVAAGTSLKPLTRLYTELKEVDAAAARVLETLALPIEPIGAEDRRRSPALPRHRRSVVFENVSYRYPGAERPAVSGVSLSVPFGGHVAIVGPNGSGKSTLISLLPRLMAPQSGRVLIDGTDIAGVNLRSLRGQISMVTQQSILFGGTIARNIAYGRGWAPMEQIVAAARAAYADEFVALLPGGYQTVLADGGEGLSGGQKQRLCIARAILRSPAILILDEATSQIDSDSEHKIVKALESFRRGRTTFTIAHRLSTVVDADLIVVMDRGAIVDQGRHPDLLRRCELYRTLIQTQMVRG